MNTSSNLFALSALTMACAMAMSGMAQAAEADQAKDQKVHQLQAVHVEDVSEDLGRTVIDGRQVDIQANGTGTVTDSFRAQSFVQYDVQSRNSTRGAEITPPAISIRGGRAYENNYMINGLSNTNSMGHDGFNAGDGFGQDPQGDQQGILLTTDQIESITILTENVSAEYGDFTGGVIDTKLRDAKNDRWHIKLNVRHTRDSWTKQHFVPGDKANDEDYQPSAMGNDTQKEFKTTTAGVTLEGPLDNGNLGALISYQKTHSSTPVWASYGTKKEQFKSSRDLDNLMIRLNTDPNSDFYMSGVIMYSPYETDQHTPMNKNSAYHIQGGGWNVALNTRANLSIGTWTNDIGYNVAEVNRDASTNRQFQWLSKPNRQPSSYADWSTASNAMEGMLGGVESTQKAVNFKSILALTPVMLGDSRHDIRVGGEALYKNAEMERDAYYSHLNTMSKSQRPNYFGPGETAHDIKATGNIQSETDLANGIIKGEQFLPWLKMQHATSAEQDYLTLAAFVEDKIAYDRFTFRPGVRVSWDDVTENVNVAPRFTMNADVLHDGRFNVNFGYNRYYGSQILAYAIKAPTIYTHYHRELDANGKVGNWVEGKTLSVGGYSLGDLDTPYSDELVLGTTVKLFDAKWSLQGVHRDYKDQLKTDQSDVNNRHMTNAGESEYNGITFAVEKAFDLDTFGNHYVSLGVTWSELEGNTTNWVDGWADRGHLETPEVYLDGELINYEDMPANNFNSDWVVTYHHNAAFMDDRLRADLLMRWESAADRIYKKGKLNGLDQYWTEENEDIFYADLGVQYDLIKTTNSTLTLNMDVLNLFDNKNLVDTSTSSSGDGSYMMGRQFFLGMTYEY